MDIGIPIKISAELRPAKKNKGGIEELWTNLEDILQPYEKIKGPQKEQLILGFKKVIQENQ